MNTQEPRNGDFVAYIEQLQRESAARLRAQSHAGLVELPHTPVGTRDVPWGLPPGAGTPSAPTATTTPRPANTPIETKAPVLDRRQAEELVERLKGVARNAPRESKPAAGPAIALVIGGLMIVHALVGDGGFVALAIGVGLSIWGFRRLRSLSAGSTADRLRRHAEYKQRVSQTFGKPPSR